MADPDPRTEGIPREVWNTFSQLPGWLRYATVLIPFAGFVIGSALHSTAGIGNSGSFLTTLAVAQASVLAIVFSVTILGIQLVAQRYSPRIISLFTESAIFRFTFALFIASIAADLILIYNNPQQPPWWFTGLVYGSAGLAIVSVSSLYTFIKNSIDRITPRGIAEAFVDDLTPEKYFREAEELAEDDSRHAHPAYPLKSMIMSALTNRERVTAEETLQQYGELTQSRLQFFIDEDWFPDPEEDDTQFERHLFKPVLEEQLHEIALHAQELEESEIAEEAITWQYELGKTGLDTPGERVAVQTVSGLTTNLTETPLEDGGHVVNHHSWDKLGDLLQDTVDHPAPGTTMYILSMARSRATRQVALDVDPWVHGQVMLDLYRKLVEAHSTLIERHGETLAELDFDWQHDSVQNDTPNRQTARIFETFLRTITETTGSFLKYFEENDHYPFTEGNFRRNWQALCVDASNSPAREYSIALCQALIEVAFIATSIDAEEEHFWLGALDGVKDEGDPEILQESFERLLSYEFVHEDYPVRVVGGDDDFYAKYYGNLIEYHGYGPLNTHPDYPQRVENLRREVMGQ